MVGTDEQRGVCQPEELPADCSSDVAFTEVLDAVCRLCAEPDAPASPEGSDVQSPSQRPAPCSEDVDGSVFDLIYRFMALWPQKPICIRGFFAAYLTTLQLSTSNRPVDIAQEVVHWALTLPHEGPQGEGFDLRPYPFWSEQRSLASELLFHSRFMSAHFLSCNDAKVGAFRGVYALRAGHDKRDCHCAVRLSDDQLLRRCRARRSEQLQRGQRGLVVQAGEAPPVARPLRGIASILCPDAEAQAAFAMHRRSAGTERSMEEEEAVENARRKYTRRAIGNEDQPGPGCEDPSAEWKVDLSIYHKCILIVILERWQLQPGAKVLDWGCGCGHKLTWAAQLYDIEGLGVDIVEESVRWARQHSAGRFCTADGRFVDWLPDDTFDAVISYAALAHLEPDDQCRVVTELVGKLRVGGRMWFGWNSPGIWRNDSELESRWMHPPQKAWQRCFTMAVREQERWASGEISIVWETQDEAMLFPTDITRVDGLIYLYWPPAYSLFVTRAPQGHAHEVQL